MSPFAIAVLAGGLYALARNRNKARQQPRRTCPRGWLQTPSGGCSPMPGQADVGGGGIPRDFSPSYGSPLWSLYAQGINTGQSDVGGLDGCTQNDKTLGGLL